MEDTVRKCTLALIVCMVTFGQHYCTATSAALATVVGGGGGGREVGESPSHHNVYVDWTTELTCETETFNVSCRPGEVILLSRARYGRMEISRCVKIDYGSLGCQVDVLGLADGLCSGRRACHVTVPDVAFARRKPCPDDLKPYLEMTYTCVAVASGAPLQEVCRSHSQLVLSGREGYISNKITEATYCGGVRNPWIVKGQPGQTINVYLYDFDAQRRTELNKDGRASSLICDNYATIREWGQGQQGQGHNLTVCGSETRERQVFVSKSNRIEISIVRDSERSSSRLPHHYLLKYEIIGCADVTNVPFGWAKRVGLETTVHCNYSTHIYKLSCNGLDWVGAKVNCTPGFPLLIQKLDLEDVSTLPYGLSVLIVLAIALLIGLCVLAIGLLFLKKQRSLCFGMTSSHRLSRDMQLYDKHHLQQQQYMASSSLPAYCSPASRHKTYGGAGVTDLGLGGQGQGYGGQEPLMSPADVTTGVYGQLRPQRLPCGCATYVTRSELGGYKTATIARKESTAYVTDTPVLSRSAVFNGGSGVMATDYNKLSTFTGGKQHYTGAGAGTLSRRESEAGGSGGGGRGLGDVLQTDDIKITMRTTGTASADHHVIKSPPPSSSGDLFIARQQSDTSTTAAGDAGKVTVNLIDMYTPSKALTPGGRPATDK